MEEEREQELASKYRDRVSDTLIIHKWQGAVTVLSLHDIVLL